jgi:S1-C subfamily serine protease
MRFATTTFAPAGAALALAFAAVLPAGSAGVTPRERSAVVKLHVTSQSPDYQLPWQMGGVAQGSGSGFLISRRRILTNAHMVSDVRFLEVQKEDDPRRYPARVQFVAHDCDLAVLEVNDEEFFEGVRPLRLADALPRITEEVVAVGYPLGGERISVTRGVVSRIDYNVYSHSGVDAHLVLQVDAAINPGNSGGPVLLNRRVVGVAFQGLTHAQSIGYVIPLPVVRRFLADIEDGHYDGYPELGAETLAGRNPALRADLGIPGKDIGIVVAYLDPFGAAHGALRTGDTLLAIDGHSIADDGNVTLEGEGVQFSELLERKQVGDAIRLDVWRDGARREISVTLTNAPDPFLLRNRYDVLPRYVVRAGLVFCPLTGEYLRGAGDDASPNGRRLAYYALYAKRAGFHRDFDEFVVLTRRLAHPVNAYADRFLNGIVTEVNGRRIRRLDDLAAAFREPARGFHIIRFAEMDDPLVIRAADAQRHGPEILAAYGVPAAQRLTEARP